MFVVIEGLDGAGKSTQMAKIKEWFTAQGKEVEYLHFPRFSTPVYGDLVAKFLRGELGAIGDVNPYLVALIYAGDRAEAKSLIQGWLDEGKVVLLDRYVLSNVAYQCAKSPDKEAVKELKEWILEMEYTHNAIPKPDVEIFLEVPFSFTEAKLQEERTGEDRDYLQGKKDIHEASLTFQQRVKEVYMSHLDKSYHIVECGDIKNQRMLPIEAITNKIIELLKGTTK